MDVKSLHTVEDNEFGRGGPYGWPGDLKEADKFLDVCTFMESSAEWLEFEFYEEDDAEDVRERFKGALEWPLPYLVASAAYYFLASRNKMVEGIWNVGRIDGYTWSKLFSVLLTVGEPLFQMIKRNRWAELNKEFIREGFRKRLEFVIWLDDRKSQYMKIQWFHEKEGSWFQIGAQRGRVSPENLLGCLALASVNEAVARLAVKEVFETETLYPFYTALLSKENQATDTDFAASFAASPPTIDLPATNERDFSRMKHDLPGTDEIGFSRMKHVKKDWENKQQGSHLIQSTFFKAALAIVFVTVFCLPRRPLVSRALSFCRDFHFVALVNQPGPPFAMIYSRSTVPVKTTTGEVQEKILCSHVKIHRQFTGKVVIPRSLSESRLRTRAQRPIRLGCFADLQPENRPFVDKQREPLGRQEIPMPFFCIANLDGNSIETHPDEAIVYHEYCDTVIEDTVIEDTVIEGTILDENQSNESNSQSESDSVADLLVDPISLEEIQQLVPDEVAESSQPSVRDPKSTLASDLTAGLHVSEATQTQETTDTTVVETVPLFDEFLNLPLSREAEEYLAEQPLQVFQRTQSKLAAAGIDPDRLLSSQSSVDRSELASVLSSEPSLDSNGNARVKTGFVAIKHLRLTKESPELAALRKQLPMDSKINVVVAIQRGRGGVGKIVRVGLDGTVCQECDVKGIVTLCDKHLKIDGQRHPIAPYEKNHLTLTPVGLPYDLRSKGTNGSDQSFVMLLPKSLHDLHTAWWRDAGPRYDFRNRNQTVEDFYSATREHDCNLWLKHEDKLAAYGLTPQDIIEATKHGHQLDNMMMDLKIKSEWSQREETNKTKQVPAFVLNKRIIYAATQTSGSYNHQLRFPVVDEIATREMYQSFTAEQKAAVKVRYNRKMKEASLVKRKDSSLLIKYYERLYKLAHHLEVLSRLPEARQEGVTNTQIHEHITIKNFVINTFSALIDTILTDVSFKEAKEGFIKTMQTWKTQTLLSENISSRNELLDTVADTAESLSLHFSHKTITKNLTVHRDARASQALLKECVLKVNEIAQKETKEKEKKAYYFGGGRTL